MSESIKREKEREGAQRPWTFHPLSHSPPLSPASVSTPEIIIIMSLCYVLYRHHCAHIMILFPLGLNHPHKPKGTIITLPLKVITANKKRTRKGKEKKRKKKTSTTHSLNFRDMCWSTEKGGTTTTTTTCLCSHSIHTFLHLRALFLVSEWRRVLCFSFHQFPFLSLHFLHYFSGESSVVVRLL